MSGAPGLRGYFQTTWLSVTTPCPSGRTAQTAPACPICANTRPWPATGRQHAECLPMASTRQTSLPVSGSYPYNAMEPRLIKTGLPCDVDDDGRGERFAVIAVAGGLARGRVEVLKIDAAVGLPDGLSRLLIQGDDVLAVAAVEVQDQQILVNKRRRAGTSKVIADEIGALPEHLARLGVQTGVVRRAEAHVDAAFLDHRRRRRIGVEGVAILRLRHVVQRLVEKDLARILVDAKDGQFRAILGSVAEPDAIAPDHRRRPCLARNRRLPHHVLLFAPPQRQVRRVAVSLVGRAAIARPMLAGAAARVQTIMQQKTMAICFAVIIKPLGTTITRVAQIALLSGPR